MVEISTVTQQAASALRELILSGEYPPGEMLSQRKLAKDLGVSTIAIREALLALAHEGLVENIPKWGTRVVEFSLERLRAQYVVREALEGMAARMAAERVTDEQIRDLFQVADRVDLLLDDEHADIREAATAHYDLHLSIARLSGCEELVEAVTRINLQSVIWNTSRVVNLAHIQQPPVWHHRLVEALGRRDPDHAEDFMRQHVRTGLEHTLAALEKQPEVEAVAG